MADIVDELKSVVGAGHVLTSESATYGYRKGFRFGTGRVEAVVIPGSLVELWRVSKLAVESGRIVLMQAANTGLTGGSTPDGDGYDRPIILISTRRLKGIQLLGEGRQVVCLPGADLYELEEKLAPLGREPHSVIGSSCIGASVLGGVSNNSGGALVQRGPAYTELALYGQVDAQGRLHLVNHLGIRFQNEDVAESVLDALEHGRYSLDDVDWSDGRKAHDDDYVNRIRQVDEASPGRYNADPGRLFEASGNAGKLIVFAVRLDTFPAARDTAVFYIGSNRTDTLEKVRRHLLTAFDELPIAGEYMHRDAFAIADRYGRDTVALIRFLGTKYLPVMFRMKAWMDSFARRLSWVPDGLSDLLMQFGSRFLPSQVPARMMDYHRKYDHHLMLRVSGTLARQVRPWLKTFFADGQPVEGGFFECTTQEGKLAFLHRFAAAGAANRYVAVHSRSTGGMMALDVALRRNDWEWLERLPQEVDDQLVLKLYYGHFLCHVMHQDYVVRPGVDPMEVEKTMMWPLLDKRGARYPAEHNVGHLYHAPQSMADYYRSLDPCNCLNPGIGRQTKRKDWVAESV